MIPVAVAWAGAPVHIQAPERCRRWTGGARCLDGRYEITTRVVTLRPGATERSATIGRFLDLLDWPRCRFMPALLDGTEGIQARCDDGDQAWISRWWIVDGLVLSQAIAGPAANIDDAADQWFRQVGFVDRPISAPAW